VRRASRRHVPAALFHVSLLALAVAALWGLTRLVGAFGYQPPLFVVIVALFAGGALSLAVVMIVLPGVTAGEIRDRLLHLTRSRRFHDGVEIAGLEPGLMERVATRLFRVRT
jgi:hypothetical protein